MAAPRAVLDSNVIVSGLRFGGTPGALLLAAGEGTLDGVVSLYILEEVRDVLRRRQLELTQLSSDNAAADLARYCDVLVTGVTAEQVCSDAKDDAVVQTAVLGDAQYIVTGDKALLKVDVPGVTFVTPAQMLELLDPGE